MAGQFINRFRRFRKPNPVQQQRQQGYGGNAWPPRKESYLHSQYTYTPVIFENYNGEKNFGELGAVSDYYIDQRILALRSWQSYLENDISQLIINDFVKWILGTGLKLEAQPKLRILESEGIKISEDQLQNMSQLVEDKFNLHVNSRYSVYSRVTTLQSYAKEVYKHAALSGDCLIIIREFEKGGTNIELIDGMRVQQPLDKGNYFKDAEKRGNKILNGIEMNSRGGHVAFFVRDPEGLSFKRIPAKGTKTGRTQAFLVYANKYRISYNRGIPILSCILETLKKLDRYKEATVGSAEERAKIVMQIVHDLQSTGENPMLDKVRNALSLNDNGINQDQTRGYNLFDETAQKIATTSNKEVYNMPQGAELKTLESKVELYFKEFIDTNINLICASMGIPPEVAKKQYDSNYSASRMAIKSWEHSLRVWRAEFAMQFYKPVYNQFLETEILKGKITAPGYLQAIIDKNYMILEAYRCCQWVGVNVPSVDPVKEVTAERMKLGDSGKNVPLVTPEKATENLGEGDFTENAIKFKKQVSDFEIKQE